MIALLQRVKRAKVTVDAKISGEIGTGWLVFLGVSKSDNEETARWLADRVLGLRAFADEAGKMNRSVADVCGSLLIVSQFTLLADCFSGRRPSFTAAAPPDEANRLYEFFTSVVRESGLNVATGIFAAHMEVELLNDGPVTFWIDSDQKFLKK
jgi:D-tyrosyl-tRNA(Tyr) deacylase